MLCGSVCINPNGQGTGIQISTHFSFPALDDPPNAEIMLKTSDGIKHNLGRNGGIKVMHVLWLEKEFFIDPR